LRTQSRSVANKVDDAGQIRQYLGVCESQDDIPLRLKPSIAVLIASLARRKVVRFSVKLDDDARGVACEVRDETAKRHLPSKS
jgi:hypothetical protein